MQPDPIVPQPGNAQALNRYSYVLNNPLKYTDPTGHAAKVSQTSGLSIATRLAGWTPNQVKLPLGMIKSAAAAYGVPWQVVAGLLSAEIGLDTGWMDTIETGGIAILSIGGILGIRTARSALTGAYLLRPNPGPGIGNVHLTTARAVSDYFAQHYGDNAALQLGFGDMSTESLAFTLTWNETNIDTVAAYVRMLADYRFGSNGEPSLVDHSDLASWTMTDAVAIWHGYRYGVSGVSPDGSGFNVSIFQCRSLSMDMTVTVAEGAGKAESMYGAIPYFDYYFGQ